MTFIYPDTSIWNCLCEQNEDPGALVSTLAKRQAALALGFNVSYEIAKLFFSGEEKAERGRELFAYMKGFLDLRVPIVKENWALLVQEALDVTGTQRMESCFRNDSDYQVTIQEIDKLCRGEATPEAARFFASRKAAAQASRTMIGDRLEVRPDLKEFLEKINDEALPSFLASAGTGPAGQYLLTGHLRAEFSANSATDLAGVAALLLQSPRYRVSHAMTRADLYLNWRCVKRRSIRSDLPDDIFHVVSAAYSDIFVTTESDQANIARHAMPGISTIVCDPCESIVDRFSLELGTALISVGHSSAEASSRFTVPPEI